MTYAQRPILLSLLILTSTLGPTNALADRYGQFEWSGHVGAEARFFIQDSSETRQNTDTDLSLSIQPELQWYHNDGNQRISLIGFARAGAQDAERNHTDIREAYWAIEKEGLELLIGINKVFWGVTESNHLVDIINQTDAVEDIDGEEKLGQPMININWQNDWGNISAFMLPYFRERTFPGAKGRLRTLPPVDANNAQYQSAKEDHHPDWALRYSHYFGDIDLGVYLFDGTNRDPRYSLADNGQQLRPYYEQISQAGLDLQYTTEAWLWKLELINRNSDDEHFTALAAGYEYTFYQIFNSNADWGLLMEGHYDGRNENNPSLFDQDVFIGGRLALNDSQDTSLLAGVMLDTDTNEQFYNLEAERRLSDGISGQLRLRAFTNTQAGDTLHSMARDDYAQVVVKGYF